MAVSEQGLEYAIRLALEEYVRRELDKEIEAAQKRIGEVMQRSAAQIVMSVLKEYEVMQDRHSITIRVRNEANAQ